MGRVGARPTSDETQFQINLQTKGRLTTPEEFGAIVVRANPTAPFLRVRDVARVELGAAQTEDSESRLNGNPAVTIGVYLAPGRQRRADRGSRCRSALDELGEALPREGCKSIGCSTTAPPSCRTRSRR